MDTTQETVIFVHTRQSRAYQDPGDVVVEHLCDNYITGLLLSEFPQLELHLFDVVVLVQRQQVADWLSRVTWYKHNT